MKFKEIDIHKELANLPILIPLLHLKDPETVTDFTVREFFLFKLKESHAPENKKKNICF